MQPVIIGTAGAGYAARLHGNGYRNVSGIPFRLKTVCDLNTELAEKVRKDFGYESITDDYDSMLADPEINVIDIVTPPFLHIPMAVKALRAGKHVICEKPLTGYFGRYGDDFGIESVTADVGTTTKSLNDYEHRHISARPEDVEDYAAVTVTFADGTKCLTIASDTVLGGTKNYIEVYANDTALTCNITPTDILNTYFLDEDGLEDVYISEMLPSKLGWNKAFVSDEIIRGYANELKDFLEAAAYDREAVSGFDVAYETTTICFQHARLIFLNN
ncbi:MAG: Gfo/Idh/MocA family oxidoreductase [Synergistaceae bacterium]|nr:Gfo/Idh/MocA family oxidoreductase [Synergistaceae bacterium]